MMIKMIMMTILINTLPRELSYPHSDWQYLMLEDQHHDSQKTQANDKTSVTLEEPMISLNGTGHNHKTQQLVGAAELQVTLCVMISWTATD